MFLVVVTLQATLLVHTRFTLSKLPDSIFSVAAIIAAKLDHVVPIFDAWIGVKERSRYDTNNIWTLANFFPVQTRDQQEALQQSIDSLVLLQFGGGPEESKNREGAICYYLGKNSSADFGAIAITPAMEDSSAIMKLSTLRK